MRVRIPLGTFSSFPFWFKTSRKKDKLIMAHVDVFYQVVVNPGSKTASIWDAGPIPMSLSMWKEHIAKKKPNLRVRKVVPLRMPVPHCG